jgi:uncharacterized membrane protein
MKNKILSDLQIKKLVLTSILSVFTCVSTMVIQIPSPMNGYLNLGDCMVLTDGVLLYPMFSWFAAGVGSMLADILSGYVYYAPGTFVIKTAMVMEFRFLYVFSRKRLTSTISFLLASIASELTMVIGYFIYSALLLGNGLAAVSSIPGNLIQGIFGIIASFLLFKVLEKTKLKTI